MVSVTLRNAQKENKRVSAHLFIYSLSVFKLSLRCGLDFELG